MIKLRIVLAGFLLFSAYDARAAETEFESLDTEYVKALTLEPLFDERLKKVVQNAGVRESDFTASTSVHVVAQKMTSTLPEKRDKKNGDDQSDPLLKDVLQPSFLNSSFKTHTLLSADDLIRQFKLLKNTSEDLEGEKDLLQPPAEEEYFVDSVYIQVALKDAIYSDAHARVEKAIHESFDILVPGKLKFDVNPLFEPTVLWYIQVFRWVSHHPQVVMEGLLFLGFAFLLTLFRLLPSWYLRKGKKKSAPPTDAKDARKPDVPISSSEDQQKSQKDQQTKELELKNLQEEIIKFLRSYPEAGRLVLANWINDQEPAEKVSFLLEFLAKHGFSVGKIEVRGEQLRQMKEKKRQPEVLSAEDQLGRFKEAYWDLLAAQHFKQETPPSPLDFLNYVDDQLVLKLIKSEPLEVQARVIASLNEKRAASLISKYSQDKKVELMESFFSLEKTPHLDLEAIAVKLKSLLMASSPNSIAGSDAIASILNKMDFNSQFAIASGFLELDSEARDSILKSYFNVAFLPLVSTSFLEKIFTDLDSSVISAALSQFDEKLLEKVKNVLPPMQKRMLENTNLKNISRSDATKALQTLNTRILDLIRTGKVELEEAYAFEAPSPLPKGDAGSEALKTAS